MLGRSQPASAIGEDNAEYGKAGRALAKTPNQRVGGIVKIMGLLIASVLLSLLLLEVGVRIYAVMFFPRMMELDDRLGWRHAKDSKKTFVNEFGEKVLVVQNAYGNRGMPYRRDMDNGSYRVLAVGDSFTEGVQVSEQDLFTRQMELSDSGLEVTNVGVGGYGTIQEYLYIAEEGLRFNPNVLMLMFYENDLTDNCLSYYPGFGPRPYAKLVNGKLEIIETLDSSEYEKFILPVPFRMFLNDHSYFYYFLNSRIYQPLLARRMKEMQQADLRKIDTDKRFKVFFGVLDKLRTLLARRGVDLLVVLIPTADEVAKGSSQSASAIAEFCRAESIDCVSLLEKFRRETAAGKQLYFTEDIHWTKAGHHVAAQEIVDHLQRKRETVRR